MSRLPRLRVLGGCIAELDWEAETTTVQLVIGKLVFELVFGRIDRVFAPEAEEPGQ